MTPAEQLARDDVSTDPYHYLGLSEGGSMGESYVINCLIITRQNDVGYASSAEAARLGHDRMHGRL